MSQPKFLLCCWYDPSQYSMIVHHINGIKTKSRFNIDIFNCFDSKLTKNKSFFGLFTEEKFNSGKSIDISKYDGIIIHNTLSYNVQNVIDLGEQLSPKLYDYQGVKVLMKQDETLRTNQTLALLNGWNFDLYLTCIPEDQWNIYFTDKVSPKLNVMHTLTGYVEDRMKTFKYSQDDDRPVDIFYRGMLLPYFFGSLAYEKFHIGEKFKEICQDRNLKCDISSDMKDRLHGDNWLRALSSSKGTLAAESGGSIFDWDGTIEKKVLDYLGTQDHVLSSDIKISFKEVYDKFLKDVDGIVSYAQVSPRHFEAAATRTVPIMFEGKYSNIFQADKHYLSLKKDFSNLDDVLDRFRSSSFRKQMTDCAFDDIILSDKYSYDTFMKNFDQKLRECLDAK